MRVDQRKASHRRNKSRTSLRNKMFAYPRAARITMLHACAKRAWTVGRIRRRGAARALARLRAARQGAPGADPLSHHARRRRRRAPAPPCTRNPHPATQARGRTPARATSRRPSLSHPASLTCPLARPRARPMGSCVDFPHFCRGSAACAPRGRPAHPGRPAGRPALSAGIFRPFRLRPPLPALSPPCRPSRPVPDTSARFSTAPRGTPSAQGPPLPFSPSAPSLFSPSSPFPLSHSSPFLFFPLIPSPPFGHGWLGTDAN